MTFKSLPARSRFWATAIALLILLLIGGRVKAQSVGIGTTTPDASAALDIRAHASAVVAGSVTAVSFSPSDARLKYGIRPLRGALAGVLALRGVRYCYRQHLPGRPLPDGDQVGVIAQEVEQIYPELVSTDAEGFKAVNYAQLTPVLLEAIKELAALNAAQNADFTEQLSRQQDRDEAQSADIQSLKVQLARLLGEASTARASGR